MPSCRVLLYPYSHPRCTNMLTSRVHLRPRAIDYSSLKATCEKPKPVDPSVSPDDFSAKSVDSLDVLGQPCILEEVINNDAPLPPPSLPPGMSSRNPPPESTDQVSPSASDRHLSPAAGPHAIRVVALATANKALHPLDANFENIQRCLSDVCVGQAGYEPSGIGL